MSILTYVYILVVCFVADSMQTNFMTCNNQPAPISVDISGCKTLPCPFKRGSNVEGYIKFNVAKNLKTLKPVVDVQLGDVHMDYALPQQNACKDLVDGECPLDKGESVTYHLKMPVHTYYPTVSMTIQLSLVDESNISQMCLRIPAHVVN
ncbi:NPC intracellular cholesterol transporter 2 [Ptiloglossa arizonensis]|uniref:NPC intracellular cholesterol transporter 2 n=1 Tax=Ptiloglossa arizonensis TaxID=3350558 RepID=UPI003FA0D226